MPVRSETASVNSSTFSVSEALPLESKRRSALAADVVRDLGADELLDRLDVARLEPSDDRIVEAEPELEEERA